MIYLEAATTYHNAGLKIIPFWNKPDGSKAFPDGYARYRDAQSIEDINRLFGVDADGICLLCTDGIEAIDIDTKHDPKGSVLKDLLEWMQEFDCRIDCVIQKTKSGGNHIIYRCPNPSGNLKLARRRGEKEAMIETRGAGGLLFIAPTPGYVVTKGSLCEIPDNTAGERDLLISVCKHLDEPETIEYQRELKNPKKIDGKTPWQDFDEKTDVLDLMEAQGWTIVRQAGDYIRMNRPGAKHPKGVDGSVIKSANLFYPFTSSEVFTPEKAYSPSAVFALLEHRGDFSAAARDLYQKGFGDRIETVEVKKQLPDLIAKVEATRFNVHAKIEDQKALLRLHDAKTYRIAGRGMIGVFTGHEKSGKSFVLSCIAASGLGMGRESLCFTLDLDGGQMLWFDTEQSEEFYRMTQRRVHFLSGIEDNVFRYAAFHLRRLNSVERLEVIEYFIYNTPGLSVAVIDGFVDLVKDYNNLVEVQELMGRLMRWSDEKKILILGVLHVNKGDGKIRGHFGSELKNKCDFVIHTTKHEGGRYEVANPTSRYGDFPAFSFSRDEDGNPVYQKPTPYTPTQFPVTKPPEYLAAETINGTRSDSDIPF